MSDGKDWKDKVAIVTGGSAGLGRALAEAWGRAGAKVVIAARGAEQLGAVAGQLQQLGYDVTPIATDVTRQDQVEALVARTLEQHGRLDVLVNNAGRSVRGELLKTRPEDFQELLDLNFLALVRCTLAAAPHLIESRGHVVNIGSLASKSAARYLGAYPVSKFAVAAYSQQLRYEMQPHGVHVLLVCPGPIARDDAGPRYQEQASGLPEAAQRPGGGVKVSRISPDQLATAILRACQRRRVELVVPPKARLLFALSQLWPSLGDWIVAKMT